MVRGAAQPLQLCDGKLSCSGCHFCSTGSCRTWVREQYWEILCRIREKYYPEKTMRVRRSLFVGRRNLELTGVSITGEEVPYVDEQHFARRFGFRWVRRAS